MEQNPFNKLQMVPFECPRVRNPLVTTNVILCVINVLFAHVNDRARSESEIVIGEWNVKCRVKISPTNHLGFRKDSVFAKQTLNLT